MRALLVALGATFGVVAGPLSAGAGAVIPVPKAKVTPVNTQAPTVTGTPAAGQVLTCSTGAWSGSPNSFSYAWLRNGSPIPGAVASTYTVQEADRGAAISCQVTASVLGGEYTITGLPSGPYKVEFEPNELSGNYLPQFFSGKTTEAEAATVAVTQGLTTPNIGAALATGGEISGRVTNEAGTGLVGFSVCAHVAVTGSYAGCTTTTANGEYTIVGLPAGPYKVGFGGVNCAAECVEEYVEQFYSGKATLEEGQEVAVTPPSDTSGINAVLVPRVAAAGAISGTVEGGGKGLERVYVCADGAIYECTYTNANGEYTIPHLPSGDYLVGFQTELASGVTAEYSEQWWNDKASFGEAEDVEVIEPATTTGIDATLTKGGKLVGTVTGQGGEPLANVNVCAAEPELYDRCATTGGDGKYELAGAPSGSSYEVTAYPATGSDYVGVTRLGVEVAAPSTTTENIALALGGRISGRETNAGGSPLAGSDVCAVYPGEHFYAAGCARTNANGEYTIMALEAGSYYVYFFGEQCTETFECTDLYLGSYYPSNTGATPVPVSPPSTVANIDQALVEGGKISGKVTSAATGANVFDVYVCASTDEAEGKPASYATGCAFSGEDGNSASARSNSLQVPGKASFKLVKKKFNAKKNRLEFVFEFAEAGTVSWTLAFKNSDVGFKDALEIPFAEAAKSKGKGKGNGKGKGEGKGKKSGKCKKSQVKHKGKCVSKTVPFGKGSQSVAAGKVEIQVPASAAARKGLKSGDTLHVSGPFDFKVGSSTATIDVKVVAKPAKKKGGKKGHGKKKHGGKGK